MSDKLRTVWTLLKLLVRTTREIPRFYLDRADAFVKHEQAKDTLEGVAGGDSFAYQYAARGNGHIALHIAQAGLAPEQAVKYRDQGFTPEEIRGLAYGLAGKDQT
jgi:hypothetical protein